MKSIIYLYDLLYNMNTTQRLNKLGTIKTLLLEIRNEYTGYGEYNEYQRMIDVIKENESILEDKYHKETSI